MEFKERLVKTKEYITENTEFVVSISLVFGLIVFTIIGSLIIVKSS